MRILRCFLVRLPHVTGLDIEIEKSYPKLFGSKLIGLCFFGVRLPVTRLNRRYRSTPRLCYFLPVLNENAHRLGTHCSSFIQARSSVLLPVPFSCSSTLARVSHLSYTRSFRGSLRIHPNVLGMRLRREFAHAK